MVIVLHCKIMGVAETVATSLVGNQDVRNVRQCERSAGVLLLRVAGTHPRLSPPGNVDARSAHSPPLPGKVGGGRPRFGRAGRHYPGGGERGDTRASSGTEGRPRKLVRATAQLHFDVRVARRRGIQVQHGAQGTR